MIFRGRTAIDPREIRSKIRFWCSPRCRIRQVFFFVWFPLAIMLHSCAVGKVQHLAPPSCPLNSIALPCKQMENQPWNKRQTNRNGFRRLQLCELYSLIVQCCWRFELYHMPSSLNMIQDVLPMVTQFQQTTTDKAVLLTMWAHDVFNCLLKCNKKMSWPT